VRHSGDNLTGEGGGDDETITVDLEHMPTSVEKLAILVNSYNGQPLSTVKFAYVRIISGGRTHAFFGMGKDKVPHCTGLLFGVVRKTKDGSWEFITTAAVANGFHLIEVGRKLRMGW